MKLTRTILILAFLTQVARAQHLELLTGIGTEPMLHNPAAAGEKGWLAMTAGTRQQWLGFDGAPATYYFTLHTPLIRKKVNLGFSAIHDEIGIFKQDHLSAVYAYRMTMGKIRFSFGINGGITLGRSEWSELTTIQNPDATFSTGSEKFLYPEAGAGLQVIHSNFNTHLSIQNLLAQEFISGVQRSTITFAGEYYWKLNKVTWSPFLAIRSLHHSPLEIELQFKGTFNKAFTIGAGYRLEDAFLLLAGFRLNEQIFLYYSYEQGISKLQDHHTGSHELLLRYEFGYPVNSESPRRPK